MNWWDLILALVILALDKGIDYGMSKSNQKNHKHKKNKKH